MTEAPDGNLQRMATALGSAGLAPFVACAAATWVDSQVLGEMLAGVLLGPAQGLKGVIEHILSVYAVAVLASEAER